MAKLFEKTTRIVMEHICKGCPHAMQVLPDPHDHDVRQTIECKQQQQEIAAADAERLVVMRRRFENYIIPSIKALYQAGQERLKGHLRVERFSYHCEWRKYEDLIICTLYIHQRPKRIEHRFELAWELTRQKEFKQVLEAEIDAFLCQVCTELAKRYRV